MAVNTGGPAFPNGRVFNSVHPDAIDQWESEGMSLRDYFATHAPECPVWFRQDFGAPGDRPFNAAGYAAWMNAESQWRYYFADAMLSTRSKEGK